MHAQPGLPANRSMPPGIIIPELVYSDLSAAVDWLCQTFGFTERLRIGSHRCQLTFEGASIVAVAQKGTGAAYTPEVMDHAIMVRVADVDQHYQHAQENGAHILTLPETFPFGERQYTVVDPGYHVWTFTQSVADVDPEEWAGNRLITP